MDDFRDVYLDRALKNWAAAHRPPANLRARILYRAGQQPINNRFDWLPMRDPPDILLKWASAFSIWGVVQPFDNTGMAGSRMLV